ncbi:hypothetical protein FQN54_009516 [Arachnomyces sp. PD_36]|nr:hypothetical protein FQN54_009516 [Arachnomyces sp. PD_36]
MDPSHGKLRRASSDESGEQQWLRNRQLAEGRRISAAEQSTGGLSFGNARTTAEYAASRRSSGATGPGSTQAAMKPPQQKPHSHPKDSNDSYSLRQAHNQFTFPTYSSNTSRGSSTKTSSSSLRALNEHLGTDSRGSTHTKSTNPSTITEGVVHSSHTSPQSSMSEPMGHSGLYVNTGSDYPIYPDQSYAVLQSQVYPSPYQSHSLRNRGSRPSHHSLHSDFTLPSRIIRGTTPPTQGSRTAGNTPVSSPGLFSGPSSKSTPTDDSIHPPYLHPTHLQAPKETHTVEVDRDMLTGNKLINEYEILDELGRGQHGKVKLGRHLKTGQKVAIKIVQRYSKRRRLGKLGNPEDKVKKEVAILKKARHPNVVSLLEVIDDPNLQKVYIVLEYVENGEISWRTKGLREVVEVDKRRLEREKNGMPDSPSILEENEQYIRHAQLRRQYRERRRQNKLDLAPDVVPAWSLEHGGQSDDEVDIELALSRTHSSLATALALENTDVHGSPSNHSLASAAELEKRARDSYLAAVEGSMYGAYAPDPPLERRYSTASSNFGYPPSEPDWYTNNDDISYVPCLTFSEARNAFRDSVLGLEYLHYQGIIHRDIKPANLLVTSSGRVKISDFGVSYLGRPIRDEEEEMVGETDATELDDARELSKTVGTPAFYAPELCYTDPDFEASIGSVPKITGAIDVWSLGVTLYGMIFGRLPFVSDDEFSMFQTIVKNEVFIPRKRLKAVELSNSSHVHPPHIMNSNKRLLDELEYEDINDDLFDLLRRLLIKDPSKRITLKEIKYHPWVLSGLQNPRSWIEETDPSFQSKGKKIEVSSEEVTSAVTKIPFIQRVRSNVARWGNIFSRSSQGRKRAPSAATASTDTLRSSSTSSSNSTVGRDAMREIRRPSLRPDEETPRHFPKPSREDHPLSQSVTASPESKEDRFSYFGSASRTEPSSTAATPQAEEPGSRPDPPERTVSSAESAKTVRPFTADTTTLSSQPRATTPTLIESLGASSITGIFGGAGRRLAKGLQSGEWRSERSRSTDRLSCETDGHCEPTLAINTTSVEGRMQAPDPFREQSLSSSVRSEGFNHPSGLSGPRHWRSRSHHLPTDSETFQPSRQAILRPPPNNRPPQEPLADTKYAPFRRRESETPSNDFHPSQNGGQCSRKVAEWRQNTTTAGQVEASSSHHCPGGGLEMSPPSATTISSTAFSSSSADDFSGMSQSASHPSIPSVVSGASSLSADGFQTYINEGKKDDAPNEVPAMMRTGETVTIRGKRQGDHAEEDESKYYSGDDEGEEDESDDDDGIVFGKKKPVAAAKAAVNDEEATI